MKHSLKFIPIVILAVAVFYLSFSDKPASSQATSQPEKNKTEEILAKLTLDQKIGQLIIGGFKGIKLNNDTKDLITRYYIGGFNFLERNITSAKQTKSLIGEMQKLAVQHQSLPLFTAIDQEGGQIVRIKYLKELSAQSKIKTAAEGERVALARGKELKNLGFNMIFSPLLDYVTNPKSYLYARSFKASPDKIKTLGNAMIRGYQKGGIVPVAKHFPGHGNVISDPHKSAKITNTEENIKTTYDIFKNVIDTSRPEVIMTAHVAITGVEDKPATLAIKIITGKLRGELNYGGIIITDDLEMAAALGKKDIGAVAVEALLAGNDMLMLTLHPEKIPAMVSAIKKAVGEGKITENRINESVRKIIDLKLKVLGR